MLKPKIICKIRQGKLSLGRKGIAARAMYITYHINLPLISTLGNLRCNGKFHQAPGPSSDCTDRNCELTSSTTRVKI